MLSGAAFNALLKTLEEPPAHIKFIFATTEVHKLPATILSRCQRFDLRRIPEPLIRAHLEHICGLEKVAAEPGALDAIARYAEGGMRDAESALDQAISFYGDRVSEADVLSLFGLTGFAPVAHLGRALAQGDVGAVLKSARELAAAGKDLAKLSQDLLGFFRNLVIYQVSPTALEGEISTPENAVLAEVAPLISRGAALGILEELSHLENRLRYALAKDVVFEVALIQMSQLREKISLETILESLGGPTSPSADSPPPKSSAPASPPPRASAPVAPSLAPTLLRPASPAAPSPVLPTLPPRRKPPGRLPRSASRRNVRWKPTPSAPCSSTPAKSI
jgi:DNA polymerase-3 subunit gamma/tau